MVSIAVGGSRARWDVAVILRCTLSQPLGPLNASYSSARSKRTCLPFFVGLLLVSVEPSQSLDTTPDLPTPPPAANELPLTGLDRLLDSCEPMSWSSNNELLLAGLDGLGCFFLVVAVVAVDVEESNVFALVVEGLLLP